MKKLIIAVLFFVSIDAFAGALDNVIAYPVPFKPSLGQLTIGVQAGSIPAGNITMEIYDINGDMVYSRSYASPGSIQWGGFDRSGRKIAAGMYIIKIIHESATGDVSKKIIKIIIQR